MQEQQLTFVSTLLPFACRADRRSRTQGHPVLGSLGRSFVRLFLFRHLIYSFLYPTLILDKRGKLTPSALALLPRSTARPSLLTSRPTPNATRTFRFTSLMSTISRWVHSLFWALRVWEYLAISISLVGDSGLRATTAGCRVQTGNAQ